MRALIQRVKEASVSVEGDLQARIGPGLLIFLGIAASDGSGSSGLLARRCADLRIFEDAEGKMNRSVRETGGSALVVSQFTLYADARRGNRPSFTAAAPPDLAEGRYGEFVEALRKELGKERVQTGVFRAMMQVSLVNDGPVTIMIHSKDELNDEH